MSENSGDIKTENSVENITKDTNEEIPAKRGRKPGGKRGSSLARTIEEGEATLKGFNKDENATEGRRTTRSSMRGSLPTPPPVKKEKKTPAKGRRGRGKKEEEEEEKVEETGANGEGEPGAKENEKQDTESAKMEETDGAETIAAAESKDSVDGKSTSLERASETEDSASGKTISGDAPSSDLTGGVSDNKGEENSKDETSGGSGDAAQ